MVTFHFPVDFLIHWVITGGLASVLFRYVFIPLYKMTVDRYVFDPLFKYTGDVVTKYWPIKYAQFAHYKRRHKAKNPRVCNEDPCVNVPNY
jgi:hypothetical protein